MNQFKHDDLKCDHGVTFDSVMAKGLSAQQVKNYWPRLDGRCPLGCGYHGIAYATMEHFVAGDW